MALDLPTTLPKGINLTLFKDGAIQKFVDAGLQDRIAKAATLIPPGRHAAVLGVVNEQGAAAVAVAKVGNQLTIMMAAEHDWAQPGVKAEAALLWTPPF